MTKPIARDPMYRRRSFDADIIELCVRWYITYRLSYRDLVEMMAERGVKMSHIRRSFDGSLDMFRSLRSAGTDSRVRLAPRGASMRVCRSKRRRR